MTQSTANQPASSVLVVDDTPANLQLLAGMLKERGYKVRPVRSGAMALQAAASNPPDLILLDINMPEMNGYEVCERLKADEKLREIPVIFISALTETMDKVKAFNVGGMDYVTKPFQFEEVQARVQTHLKLERQRRELQESYRQLRELEKLRDNLVHMIVHDMRSPLTGISSTLRVLDDEVRGKLDESQNEFLQIALASAATLIEMVSSLLDVSRLESGQMPLKPRACHFAEIVDAALKSLGGVTRMHRVLFDRETAAADIHCDPDVTSRIVANLIGNAVKFTPEDGEIRISAAPAGDRVRIMVADCGPGIPEAYREKIFEKFGQVETRNAKAKYSTGLGLTFCKLASEAQGGSIGVDSEVGQGSTFWFELPAERA
jgi:signal transduction histidine kinase